MFYRSFYRAQAMCLYAWCALFFSAPSFAQAPVKLIGHLDPATGDNRYGDVWGEGDYAYLASYNGSGVMIIDISNPATPVLAGTYNPASGGRFQDVAVIDGIGYFSSENGGGVHIVDVRNPAAPVFLSQVTTDRQGYTNVHELFVADGVLYEADSRTNRVKAFDVRDPRNPLFLYNIQTTDPRFIHAIVVLNGRLYTSGWGGKTDIYDVANILTQPPALLGSVDSGNSSHSCWPSSDGKLLASARETLDGDVRLFDISNPASPRLIAAITPQSLGISSFSAHNPYILGNLLFVSWYQAGAVVVDITNPSQPRLAGAYDTFDGQIEGFEGCWGVYPFLGLNKVLASDLDGGLYVLDATGATSGPATVSAASYSFNSIAPGSIVAAFGTGLSSSTQNADSIPLPLTLGGAALQVQDSRGVLRQAPLFYVSPNQINYQIPVGTASGPASIFFSNGTSGVQVGAMVIARSAPSIFTLDQSGQGLAAAQDAFTYASGPFNRTRENGEPNAIALYITGLGADATDVDGDVASSVTVLLDGQPVQVLYAGRVPGLVGLNQINFTLPAGIVSGEHQLVVSRNGVSSNPVTISTR